MHGNCYRGYIGIVGAILGLYRDNGKENGSHYLGFRVEGLGWVLSPPINSLY